MRWFFENRRTYWSSVSYVLRSARTRKLPVVILTLTLMTTSVYINVQVNGDFQQCVRVWAECKQGSKWTYLDLTNLCTYSCLNEKHLYEGVCNDLVLSSNILCRVWVYWEAALYSVLLFRPEIRSHFACSSSAIVISRNRT